MSVKLISAVGYYEKTSDKITHVKVHSGQFSLSKIYSVEEVIFEIKTGQVYKTAVTSNQDIGGLVPKENVHVVDDQYLRTDHNDTPKDNLGNLPILSNFEILESFNFE